MDIFKKCCMVLKDMSELKCECIMHTTIVTTYNKFQSEN
jgi:hypothetical protein